MCEKPKHRKRPPHRIETDRTVVRCFESADASLAVSTISRNLVHLRPWMAWAAHEPETLEAKKKRLQANRDKFNSDIDYTYGIFDAAETELIGGTGLHTRVGADAFEIGYWIASDWVNQGIATEVSAALTKVAFEISNVSRVEIRCDPANVASGRVPQKLGFLHSSTLLNDTTTVDGQRRDTMVWILNTEDYRGSRSSESKLAAFDGAGDSMPLWS